MKHSILSLAVAFAMAGCAVGTGQPQSPQTAVFAVRTSYAAALTAAVAYKRLPVCGTPVVLPCSDPKVVTQLQKADDVASTALDSAENAVRTPGFGKDIANSALTAANAALQAFLTITATLGVK